MAHLSFRGANSASIISDAAKQGVASETYGTWAIHAEDANCDLGGPHSEPYITSFTGTLRQAAIHATTTLRSQYIGWGAGGCIKGEVKANVRMTPAQATRASADPVRAAAERLNAAKKALEEAEKQHAAALRESEARLGCMKKLEPVLKQLTNDEMNVAVEVFTGLVNNLTS